ncbi:aldehyde dehydrogenase family protein [Mycoplasmopsis ciconiae]|uniref:Aldehyde dehydrogenase n=1 Tax=Mycoplasmopsis ciconiae TaxID=561067 RepID=A0ABU7MKJ6_9BACT|nr:aldehyde dehydrogenase family protein [Mycoplasmopsis ciconiae]
MTLKQKLNKIKQIIKENESALINALKQDLNKSEYETYLSELIPVYQEINYFIRKSRKIKRFIPQNKLWSLLIGQEGYIYKPHGKVLIFNSWNYPVNLLFIPLIGALSADNEIFVKIHPFTKSTKIVLEDLIQKINAFIPQVKLEDSISVEKSLEKEWDFIFFTGGHALAELIKEYSTIHQIPICLELGGKSPAIIFEDANLKNAAKQLIFGKLLNSGQTCVAPDYILVHESVKEQLKENLKTELLKLTKNNFLNDVNFPKIININNFSKIHTILEEVNVNPFSNATTCKIEPIIVEESKEHKQIWNEEIFAPIFLLKSFNKKSEILDTYNLNPNPLIAYVFTKNRQNIDFVIENIDYGNLMVNKTIDIISNNRLSFGGYKNSGVNRYRGWSSFELFSHKSAYLNKRFDFLAYIKRHPYTNKKLNILKKILNFYR